MGSSEMVAELVQIAELACRTGNELLTEKFGTSILLHRKGDLINVVTDADLESESAIVELIGRFRPADGFMAEESARVRGTSGITWVIDPLDSTANFSRGLPVFSVSVAARDETGLIASAVGNPIEGVVYSTGRGIGGVRVHNRSGTSISELRESPDPRNALVLYGLGPRETGEHRRAADVPSALIRAFGKVRSPGSPALGLAWVAAGVADAAYYEMDFGDWDVAAGSLLCLEAGHTVIERPALAPGLSRRIIAGRPELVDLVRPALSLWPES